ncbi:MAG: calcium/sodium antiporter [Acidimicrobiales bacterium]|jgi:cation:H+ antiporter|nr:calcium/sodium antiporter [Acidimicrobiales bacterium]
MTTAVTLLAGIAAAAAGGELFVRGAVGIAAWARVPAAIIAVTVAAFATSSPEFFVALSAAADDTSAIAFGDALGSNVANVGLILGLALLIRPLTAERATVRRDLPVAVAVPFLILALVADGTMSRLDGAVLLTVFAIWLGVTVRHARRARADSVEVLGERKRGRAVVVTLVGLGLLVVAGRLIVVAAEAIGDSLGLDPFVVGATFVAFGTSMPELATVLAAGLRGHEEIGLGAIVGSNIFNGLWIVSVLTILRPFDVALGEVALSLVMGAVSILLLVPNRRLTLDRWRGGVLVGTYVLFTVLVVAGGP